MAIVKVSICKKGGQGYNRQVFHAGHGAFREQVRHGDGWELVINLLAVAVAVAGVSCC